MGVYWDNSTKGSVKGGVYEKQKRHNSWRAEITVNRVRYRLGRFKHKADAERALEVARLQLTGSSRR